MKIKKMLSSVVITGLLLNNSLLSFAGILSQDDRYETFIDNNITVNDVLEEDEVDLKIEGNTLVNLVPPITQDGVYWRDNNYMVTGVHTGHNFQFNSENNSWTWDIGNCVNSVFPVIKLPTELMIEGKQYSLIVDSTDSVTEIKNTDLDYHDSLKGIRLSDIKKGTNVINFNYNSNYKNIVFGQIASSSRVKTLSNFMILEGDWSNKPIPKYFKGMQSSFENQLVTQDMIDVGEENQENLGKYKVEVKSIGKNKFFGEWVDGSLNPDTGLPIEDSRYIFSEFLNIEPNKTYSTSITAVPYFYDKNFNYIGRYDDFRNPWTTPNNSTYVRLRITTGHSSKDIFQLEEGSVVTEYEPYKESINTFYLNSPLLEGDTIEYVNGQATHIKRYNKVVLNGNKAWYQYNSGGNDTNDTMLFAISMSTVEANRLSVGNTICDKLVPERNIASSSGDNMNDSIWLHTSPEYAGYTYIRISKSKLSTQDIRGFKQWLKENPVTVLYELKNPIYEPIKADLSVQLFEGTSYISNNSNIPVSMEIEVDRTLNRATEALELAKTNPTTENLALARMWINLLEESTLKDDLNNEANNIVNMQDLKIEKKKVSGNVDIYVKSDNMLSMTLSTNSVTFENYTGIHDMDLDNAVKITVNSSLPYRLNSYLLSDLENKDKSNKIDRDLLNIKVDTSNDYKVFTNLNEKITLEEDCDAGNDKHHNIDLKLKGKAHKADVYKAVIKFEAEQK